MDIASSISIDGQAISLDVSREVVVDGVYSTGTGRAGHIGSFENDRIGLKSLYQLDHSLGASAWALAPACSDNAPVHRRMRPLEQNPCVPTWREIDGQ
jgi:hypothetical protein